MSKVVNQEQYRRNGRLGCPRMSKQSLVDQVLVGEEKDKLTTMKLSKGSSRVAKGTKADMAIVKKVSMKECSLYASMNTKCGTRLSLVTISVILD